MCKAHVAAMGSGGILPQKFDIETQALSSALATLVTLQPEPSGL